MQRRKLQGFAWCGRRAVGRSTPTSRPSAIVSLMGRPSSTNTSAVVAKGCRPSPPPNFCRHRHSGSHSVKSEQEGGMRPGRWRSTGAGILVVAGTAALLAPLLVTRARVGAEQIDNDHNDSNENNKKRDLSETATSEVVNAARSRNAERTTVRSPASMASAVNDCRELLMRYKEVTGAPGLIITVMVKGDIVWSEGFGFADVEQGIRVTTRTRMRIASISKSLTAAAVGVLVERGLLDLDAPVQKYVPEYKPVLPPSASSASGPNGSTPAAGSVASTTSTPATTTKVDSAEANVVTASPPPQPAQGNDAQVDALKAHITPRMLGGHLAGIRHYTGNEFYSNVPFDNVKQVLEIFRNDPLVSLPGEKYSYTTYGYSLLSAVVESVSKKNFLEFMNAEIFEPLGMRDTMPDCNDKIIFHRSRQYKRGARGQLVNSPQVDSSYKWAGGGFLSTTEDLAVFGNAMITAELLRPETIDILFATQTTSDGKETGYGIGWDVAHTRKVVRSQSKSSPTSTSSSPSVNATTTKLEEERRLRSSNAEDLELIAKERVVRERVVQHSGGAVGGSSALVMMPEHGIVVAVIANLENASPSPNALALLVAARFRKAAVA